MLIFRIYFNLRSFRRLICSGQYSQSSMASSDPFAGLRIIKSGSKFVCPWGEFVRPSLWSLSKWKFSTPNRSNIPDDPKELDKSLPILEVKPELLHNVRDDQIQVTWIGHATVLVQFDGISILTDPVFRNFCGPELAKNIPKLAYWRYRKAACKIKDIPKLDAVVISHNHFDHLDQGSVDEITRRFPHVNWFVGKGLLNWFVRRGCKNVVELEWWQESEMTLTKTPVKFVCLPTQHWSQRGAFDLNKTLWCSWVVKGPTKSFYFVGDTGYYNHLFRTIGTHYGPFDLCAIPIGAYEPRYITRYQHVDPEEAVKIHTDIRSNNSIGIHWGTFEVTNEFYLEPPQKVEEEMKKRNLDPSTFISLHHGETWVVGDTRRRPNYMNEENRRRIGKMPAFKRK